MITEVVLSECICHLGCSAADLEGLLELDTLARLDRLIMFPSVASSADDVLTNTPLSYTSNEPCVEKYPVKNSN